MRVRDAEQDTLLLDASKTSAPESGGDLLARWERLRVLYNAALTAEVLIFLAADGAWTLRQGRFWSFLIFSCVMANVCFCVGPVVDGYIHRLGSRGSGSTWVLFSLGVGFSMVLAFIMLFVWPLASSNPHEQGPKKTDRLRHEN
jgi:hypothetical protein